MGYRLQKNRAFCAHGGNCHLNCMSDSKSFVMLSSWKQTPHYYVMCWIWHSQNSAHHYTLYFGHWSNLFHLLLDYGQHLLRCSCQEPSHPTTVPNHELYDICPFYTTRLCSLCYLNSVWNFLKARPRVCLFCTIPNMCWFLQVPSWCHASNIPIHFPSSQWFPSSFTSKV